MVLAVPRLRDPIVLVHGLFGFDRVQIAGRVLLNYFPGIPEMLRATGNRVLVARVSPTAGIARRAAELKKQIDRALPGEPVHVIGHSMGGLDARYMTSRLGMHDRVLSLTTLGTPHRGSSFADWGLRRFRSLVCPLFEFLGVSSRAFADLTVDSCRRFNAAVPDAPGVRYFSVAGRLSPERVGWHWHLPSQIVRHHEGDNDGIVSESSARWGEFSDVWDGDHMNLVNWPQPNAAGVYATEFQPRYASLVRRLADCGF
jgi:triacylglycerol lipase